MDLEKICLEIEKAAKKAGEFIAGESNIFNIGKAEIKGLNNFVTYVDRESEQMLVNSLGKLLPEAGFIAEEGTSDRRGVRFNWVIDPLDGTTNFLHNVRPYAISIGLMEHDEVIAGVVHEVGGNETFKAWKDGGAWLNGKRIHVSGTRTLADSLVAT